MSRNPLEVDDEARPVRGTRREDQGADSRGVDAWARNDPDTRGTRAHGLGANDRGVGVRARSVPRHKHSGSARPAPEQTALDLTGRYETVHPGERERITVQLNQAGRHIEGWWQKRVYSPGAEQQYLFTWMLSGDLVKDASGKVSFDYFRAAEFGKPIKGTLTATRVADGIQLNVSDDVERVVLRRRSTTAHLSESAIDAIEGGPEYKTLAEASEHAPLDSREERAVISGAIEIGEKLREWVVTTGKRHMREAIASRIDAVVGSLAAHAAREQLPLVRFRLWQHLSKLQLGSGSSRQSGWAWLRLVAAAHPASTPHIQKDLGIGVQGLLDEKGKPILHEYSYEINLWGYSGSGGVGVSGFGGEFIIHKESPDRWTARFNVGTLGVSAGPGMGLHVREYSTGKMGPTPFPWTPQNFRGTWTIVGGSGGGSLGAGMAHNKAAIVFHGDSTYRPLYGDASGETAMLGRHLGVEFGVTVGYLSLTEAPFIRPAQGPPLPKEAAAGPATRRTLHFAVDDATLTVEGRRLVREMCAVERAAFENSGSSLEILGFTSTTGSIEHNRRLSQLRADNTLQAIRDSLGPALKIPKERIKHTGEGKEAALKKGVKDNTETGAWRRVEVKLNGRIVLLL